jgi:hypothetical protein
VHGDQAGRDGGTKKVKEENGPLDDLDQDEDVRTYAGVASRSSMKTNSEAGFKQPTETHQEPPMCYYDLMRREQVELRTGAASASPPAPASPPSRAIIFKPLRGFERHRCGARHCQWQLRNDHRSARSP